MSREVLFSWCCAICGRRFIAAKLNIMLRRSMGRVAHFRVGPRRPTRQRYDASAELAVGRPDLAAYLNHSWAVIAAHSKSGSELVLMKQYLLWYGTRASTFYVDRIDHGPKIRAEVAHAAGTTSLPILFVNRQCVGAIDRLHELNAMAKLKDVLQFGFEWPDLHTESLRRGPYGRVSMMRPREKDELMFRARYQGVPMKKEIMSLPKFSPTDEAEE